MAREEILFMDDEEVKEEPKQETQNAETSEGNEEGEASSSR